MHKKINFYDFERAFVNMDRENQFTYEGKKALFEYLEEYEESTGHKMELDVIALCCGFQEFDSLEDFKCQYGDQYETFEDIEHHTIVIPINNEIGGTFNHSSKGANIKSFIIQDF